MKKYTLAERMKKHENVSRIYLPSRTYTLARCDGQSFSNYTKGLKKPYDEDFMEAMDTAAIALCKEAMGCKLAYVQSDEISLVLTDFDEYQTEAWFDNNLQKIATISSSTVSVNFLAKRMEQGFKKIAKFDARYWSESDRNEVINNFLWRQRDAIKNAKQSLGYSLFSDKQLHKMNADEVVKKCLDEKGIDFYLLNKGFTQGRLIYKQETITNGVVRNKWVSNPAPLFNETLGKDMLSSLIPKLND